MEENKRYPVLIDTVRMKKSTHNAIIKDLCSDTRTVTHPIQCFILALCNGTMDAEAIARCVNAAYGFDMEKCRETVNYTLQKRGSRLYWQDEAIYHEPRYNFEDFYYAPKPAPTEGKYDKPTGVTMTLTNNCDYRCIYCYNSSTPRCRPEEMSTENWLKFVDELKRDTDCFLVNITGGEPMVHPGFFPILESLHDGGIMTDISTNGSLIDDDAIKRFIDLEQKVMLISLDSSDPDTHHFMTNSSGTFPKVIRAIEKMLDAGITVNVKSLLIPQNYRGCGELAMFLDKLGVSGEMFDTYHLDAGGRGDGEFWLSPAQCREVDDILDEVTPKLKKLQFQFTPPRVGWCSIENCVRCGGMSSGFCILPDRRYTFCEGLFPDDFFSLGKYPEVGIMEMWKSDRIDKIMNPPIEAYAQTCRECERFDICRSGCFKAKMLVNADHYGTDPNCPKARYENNPVIYRPEYIRKERHEK